MNHPRSLPILLAPLGFIACAAAGQQVRPEPGSGFAPERQLELTSPDDRPFGVQLSGQATYDFESDLDGAGEVAILRTTAGFGLSAKVADPLTFRFSFDAEWSDYDFSGATGLIPADPEPWEDLASYRIAPSLSWAFAERWTLLVGADARLSLEPGADLADAATYGGFVAARYEFSPEFALTFGVGAHTRIEDDPTFIPTLGVEWTITEGLRFATRGLGGALTFDLSETLALNLRGGYEPREYRLSEDRALNAEGVVRDDRATVGLELAWTPAPYVTASLYAGANVHQEYTVEDRNGRKISELDTDPSPFIAGRVVFRF